MFRILVLLHLLILAACDPAFVKSFQIDASESVIVDRFPISDVDALAEVFEFSRAEPQPEYRERLEADGYNFVVYYRRSAPNSSNIESLSIARLAGKRSLRMDLFAFVALGEPGTLRKFRGALSLLLCKEGYVVDGVDDCNV